MGTNYTNTRLFPEAAGELDLDIPGPDVEAGGSAALPALLLLLQDAALVQSPPPRRPAPCPAPCPRLATVESPGVESQTLQLRVWRHSGKWSRFR